MARVLLGVTGGIAAYKACELCRFLVKAGHDVTPVLTPDAERFVTAHTFETPTCSSSLRSRPTRSPSWRTASRTTSSRSSGSRFADPFSLPRR
jgi:phosphopantothenoylcysteine decarboxylase / phosphopantothenate---cysteine ligase